MCKLLSVALLWLLSQQALAYFDPATGSILLQGLLAGLAGLLLTWRLFVDKVKHFFARLFKPGKEPDTNSEK